MDNCTTHGEHTHTHGDACGHVAIRHDGHVDYLHDGHLHHMHGDHCDEHVLPVTATNPADCRETSHPDPHTHGPTCGHPAIPHGDHTDFLVNGRLHHVHAGHCDDHGPVEVLSA